MFSRVYIAAFACNVCAFIGGISITWSSPVVYKLQHELDESPFGKLITDEENSWIASSNSLGALISPLIFGIIIAKFGRRISLIGLGIPSIIAYGIFAFAKSLPLYYFARALGGFAIGGSFSAISLYITEISESSNRGTLGALMNCFLTAGSLFSYCVGPYTSIMVFNIILMIIPIIYVILVFFFVPESPHYYLSKGNEQDAEKALKLLRQSEDVSKELEEIKDTFKKSDENGTIIDILKNKGLRKAFIICFGLVTVQQLSGIIGILAYAQNIFEDAGSTIEPAVCSIIIGVVEWLTSFTTPAIAERFGRKTLFLTSAVGMIISEVPIGIYFYLKDDNQNVDNISWLPLVALVLYILAYNLAYAGLPWAVMGEVFPISVKASASSCISIYACLLSFLISKFFTTVSDSIGMGELFWVFSGVCTLSLAFVSLYVIETKGKTLQEIQEMLQA